MEHLDKENHLHVVGLETCEFTLVGGDSCKLMRAPSSLAETAPTYHRRGKRSTQNNSPSDETGSSFDECGPAILRWDEEDVIAWLRETGLEIYEVS